MTVPTNLTVKFRLIEPNNLKLHTFSPTLKIMEAIMDPLSDILDLIGVKSSVYFQKDFHAPWRMKVSDTGFAQFHLIVHGEAVVEHDSSFTHVSTGDVMLFPKGASHLIGDSSDSPSMDGKDLINEIARGNEPFCGCGRATRMICGHFEYDLRYLHPLIQELPNIIHIKAVDLPIEDQLLILMKLIASEFRGTSDGHHVVLRRLSDVLFVTILRAYFRQAQTNIGWHIGLQDKRISKAIAAIHAEDGWKFGLGKLASVAGMSRSSFAATFKNLVGSSPGDYSLRWKMLIARKALTDSNRTIEQIAFDYGYSSSSAFSRAFVSIFNQTPKHVRKP